MNDLPTAGPFGPLRPDPCRMASCGDRSSSASIPIRLARAPNLAEELYEGSALDHEEAKHLLSDYVMGELSSDDAAELQAHASDCQDCREIVISMGIVKEELETYGPVLFESHPDADHLVHYALGDSGLSTDELATIGAHVSACPDCREAVEITRRAHTHAQRWWRKLVSPFMVPSFTTTPAFQLAAVVLVLVLAYPAYRGLVGEADDVSPGGLGGIPNLIFEEQRRRGTGALKVSLQPGPKHLSLILPMPRPFEKEPHLIEATIKRLADGEPVFHHMGPAADCLVSGFRIKRVNLLVPTNALSLGRFRIELHEAGRALGADSYDFEVLAP